MGKSVEDNSPSSPFGYSDWCEAFELFADVSISDCDASDVRSDNIVLGILCSSSQFLSWRRGCKMYPAFAGVALSTSQLPFGRRLLQIRVRAVNLDPLTRFESSCGANARSIMIFVFVPRRS